MVESSDLCDECASLFKYNIKFEAYFNVEATTTDIVNYGGLHSSKVEDV